MVRSVLTVLLVAVDFGFRVAVVVDLDLRDDQLRRHRLHGAVVQQLLQFLLVQFSGGCWGG